MHHHVKMLVLYMQSITISTELIAELQDPRDQEVLTEALNNRDDTWDRVFYHLHTLAMGNHPLARHYTRIVDTLICS